MKIKLNDMVEIKNNEDLGEVTDVEVFEWRAANGDAVKAGDVIVEVMVGKTSIEIAAPVDGTIQILVEEGEIVSGDDEIAEIA